MRIILFVFLTLSTIVSGQDFDATKSLAEQGDAVAQFNLGNNYSTGEGVQQDDAEAIKWYRLAAEQGLAAAQFNLGNMYRTGEGVPEDGAEAVKWFRLAAEQGYASAQFNLGYMYFYGQGIPKDDAEVVKWYRLAAEQGLAVAQSDLGYMYSEGLGVQQDDAEAVKWYRLAAEQGLASAQSNLGNMYRTGEGVPEDGAEAVKWFRLAAEQGYASAQFNLGYMYFYGQGIPKDDAEVVKWFRLAAEQGLASAQRVLGHMYFNGLGVQQDDSEAVKWYRLAVDQGYEPARSDLAYYSFIFTAKEEKWPLHYSLTAAAMGLDEAALDVESSNFWFKIPGYNAAIASTMHQAFLSCRNGIYPSYGKHVEFIERSIAGAHRVSERDALQADLVPARFFAEALTNADCLGRFALIMEGFGLDIVDATLGHLELFYADIIDLDRFHNEVALLLGMPTHNLVFKHGPWAAEADRALLAKSLESFRSSNVININQRVDIWEKLEKHNQYSLDNPPRAYTNERIVMRDYMGELIVSNALIQSLIFMGSDVSFEADKSCSSDSCLLLSRRYDTLISNAL